jgi:hypothetical protein
MFNTLETDVATSIAILDRLPSTERAAWLGRLERGSYRFVLGRGLPGSRVLNEADAEVADKVRAAIGAKYPIEVESIPGGVRRLQAHLRLSDGEPLTIDINRQAPSCRSPNGCLMSLDRAACCCSSGAAGSRCARQFARWRTSPRPPMRSTPISTTPRLSESGPSEVAHAASAIQCHARAHRALSGRAGAASSPPSPTTCRPRSPA